MLRVELRAAHPGMSLALAVRNPRDVTKTLLKIGYELDQVTITRLEDLGVKSVWVRCPGLEMLRKFFNEDVINSQAVVVGHIAEAFVDLQKEVNTKLPYQKYRRSIRDLIHNLVRNPRAAIFMDSIDVAGDGDLMSHSSSVTYLSLLMGLKLEGYLVRQRRRINPIIAKEVTAVGLGAMLHDVGVVNLPEGVYERYLETLDDTDPDWREHPALGYNMVRGQIEPSATTILLNHHQRFNGTGYAGEGFPVLEGEKIHVFARIVAVANQFDRMHNPPNRAQQPVVGVLKEILKDDVKSGFDPHVLRALLSVVPPYPPGAVVHLSDGRVGICIDHTPADPCRPMVQIIEDINDLGPNLVPTDEVVYLTAQDESLFVTHCDGQEVSHLNFPRPTLMNESISGLILKKRGKVGLL